MDSNLEDKYKWIIFKLSIVVLMLSLTIFLLINFRNISWFITGGLLISSICMSVIILVNILIPIKDKIKKMD